MRKQDVKELRKIIKRDDSAIIDWIYSLYVSPENELRYEALERLGNMEDSERFRHVKIINNVLSTALGKRTFSVPLKFQQEELLLLRKNVSDKDNLKLLYLAQFILELSLENLEILEHSQCQRALSALLIAKKILQIKER